MNQLRDDDALVTFLKIYHPAAPPASKALENQVMSEILQQNRLKSLPSHLRWWGLGTIIAVSLAFSWTLWQRHQLSSQIAVSNEEIEAFLVEGWQGTMVDPIDASLSSDDPTNWLLLGNPEGHFSDQ